MAPASLGRNYDDGGNITEAQDALLTARARYRLRNDAIESVMMANPILKAVHNGTQASPIERHVLLLLAPTITDPASTLRFPEKKERKEKRPSFADPATGISSHTCRNETRHPYP